MTIIKLMTNINDNTGMISNGIPREQTAGAMLSIENKLEWVIQIKSSLFIKINIIQLTSFDGMNKRPQGDLKSMRGAEFIQSI